MDRPGAAASLCIRMPIHCAGLVGRLGLSLIFLSARERFILATKVCCSRSCHAMLTAFRFWTPLGIWGIAWITNSFIWGELQRKLQVIAHAKRRRAQACSGVPSTSTVWILVSAHCLDARRAASKKSASLCTQPTVTELCCTVRRRAVGHGRKSTPRVLVLFCEGTLPKKPWLHVIEYWDLYPIHNLARTRTSFAPAEIRVET